MLAHYKLKPCNGIQWKKKQQQQQQTGIKNLNVI